MDAAEVDVPQVMVENELDDLVEQQARQFKAQGLELAQLLQYSGQSMEDYRKSIESSAKIHVKTELVLKAIIKKENITLTEEEKDAELEKIAKRYSMTAAMLKQQLGENVDRLMNGALLRKVSALLCSKAVSIAPTEEIKL